MIIRAAQLEAFRPLAEAMLEARLAAYLRAEHGRDVVVLPDRTIRIAALPDDLLGSLVRAGIGRARSHDLTWESNLAAFVVLMVRIAPNFDEQPTIRRVLRDPAIPPERRIDVLWDQTSEADWDMAFDGYAPDAWGVESTPGGPAAPTGVGDRPL